MFPVLRLREKIVAIRLCLEKLKASEAARTEAQAFQRATNEILSVISQSSTDVQPVFNMIVERAVELCGAAFGFVLR